MKITDILNRKAKPFATFELVPPLKGSDINKLYKAIDPLMEFKPPFINIGMKSNSVKKKTALLKK